MHLAWEALASPVHKVRSEGREPLNNLLRDPQLVSGGVSIWTQVDMPPPLSLNAQESLGEEKGVEEKGFVERLHISARPRGKGFRKGTGLRSLSSGPGADSLSQPGAKWRVDPVPHHTQWPAVPSCFP